MMPFYVDLRGNEVGREIFVLHPRNEDDVLTSVPTENAIAE
jgi:hypothetical protein